MTIGYAYDRYLQIVNKDFTNDNLAVDKGRFIMEFNAHANRVIEWYIKRGNSRDREDIQQVLVKDKALPLSKSVLNHTNFTLPEDFLASSSLVVYGKTDTCPEDRLYTWPIKDQNSNELFRDAHNVPSFPYRETFYDFASGEVIVYKKDFEPTKVYLTYYKCSPPVDIEGYISGDTGNPSSNIDPIFKDHIVERILLSMAKSFDIQSGDFNRYNLHNAQVHEQV